MTAQREMPKYQCHKQVWALKIKDIQCGFDVNGPKPIPVWTIFPEDEGYSSFEVTPDWVIKYNPQPGGYYVMYEGGYQSYSPADVFEDGYTLI